MNTHRLRILADIINGADHFGEWTPREGKGTWLSGDKTQFLGPLERVVEDIKNLTRIKSNDPGKRVYPIAEYKLGKEEPMIVINEIAIWEIVDGWGWAVAPAIYDDEEE